MSEQNQSPNQNPNQNQSNQRSQANSYSPRLPHGDDVWFDRLDLLAQQAILALGGHVVSGKTTPTDLPKSRGFLLCLQIDLDRHCEQLVSVGVPLLHWVEREVVAAILGRVTHAIEEIDSRPTTGKG
jgi:hypothetical protein